MYVPGTEGGNAIADLLFGDAVPSGKLTMTFPRHGGQIPVYYNHFRTGRPAVDNNYEYGKPYEIRSRFESTYLDMPNAPLYAFGHGLSYTTFEYDSFNLSETTLRENSTIIATINITNTGSYSGEEIVQLYIQDMTGSVVRPLLELKGFEKISLEPKETKQVSFKIEETMLRFHTKSMQFKSEKGTFKVHIGPSSDNLQSLGFKLI